MSEKKIPVAIQLYSLRSVIADDVPGTLKQIADMGYEGVEFAGYYGLPGPELKELLDRNGLRCAGSHVGLPLLTDETLEATVATNRALDTDRLIVPGANLDEMEQTISQMKRAHQAAAAMGMRVGYHNHTKEFETVDGVTKFERIFRETPDDFLVQVDIGWATAAGQDVPALLRRYAQRIETVHVKEFKEDDPAAVVGEGVVDWPATMEILEAETAVQWYIVEQEQYRVSALDSARKCIDNLRAMR